MSSVLDFKLKSGKSLQKVAEEFYKHATALNVRRVIGIDIGRVQDHTAIALVESREVLADFDHHGAAYRTENRLAVRYLERMPLGMSWPDIMNRLRDIYQSIEPEARPRTMVVDATGVGDAVVSLIREKIDVPNLISVNITAGVEVSRRAHGGGYNVPKRDLIVTLQLMMQQQRLKVAGDLPDAELLVKEMDAMEVRMNQLGREQYACWREGAHDDLVLATALACWCVEAGKW